MRTVDSIRVQDRDNLAIFKEIYGQRPDRQPPVAPAAPVIQEPMARRDHGVRDYPRDIEAEGQRKVASLQGKFRILASKCAEEIAVQ